MAARGAAASASVVRAERPCARHAATRGLRPILVALAVVVSAAGCSRSTAPSPDSNTPSARPTAVLLRGVGPDPDSLDPQRARSAESQQILRDLCEGLTALDKNAGVAPGVASEWSTTPDGKTYTFKLRPDARWSNGDRVVAADFVAALHRLVDPATGSSYAQIIDVVSNATDIIAGTKAPDTLGVAAPDDTTVVIQLATPAPYLPGLLSHTSTCPVHRATLAAHGDSFARAGTMVSNGAFILKEWVQNSHILIVRNHHYWNDPATRLEAVRYLLIADENAELTRYRAGELHITAVVPRGQFDWIKANLADQLHLSPQLTTYFYGFNLRRAPFKDKPGLRRALSLVIDREKLTELVLRVGELPAYGWVPPGVSHYTSQSFDYKTTPWPQRLAEARRLYQEAGYSSSNPLRFELRYNSAEVHTKVALAIASAWKEALGVEVRLTAVEFKSLLQDIDRGDVEMFRSSWVGDYNDAYTFLQYLKGDFGINLPHYQNPAYDLLLTRAAGETDTGKRRALLEEAERLALQDHPLIPIYFYVNKHLVKPEVDGWYDNVMNVVYSKDLGLRQANR
jgi:oligopeptide transport system substrate-binding protein